MSLPVDEQQLPTVLTHVPVQRGHEFAAVPVSAIDSIEADGNYVQIAVGADRLRVRTTLSSLIGRLDPKRFARIHRSTVVNLDRVTRVVPYAGGDCFVYLTTGTILRASRTYRPSLREVEGRASARAGSEELRRSVTRDRRAPAIEAWGR